MQLRKAVENNMFPYFLSIIQWTVLVISLAFNLNYSVAVTGAVANGGLKVIMLFHLWMLFIPVVLCLFFYRIRKEGIVEKCVVGLSIITILFSIVNIGLHFVDDLVSFMNATEVVVWSLYNSMFAATMYKISIVFLLPIIERIERMDEERINNKERLGAGG